MPRKGPDRLPITSITSRPADAKPAPPATPSTTFRGPQPLQVRLPLTNTTPRSPFNNPTRADLLLNRAPRPRTSALARLTQLKRDGEPTLKVRD